MSFIDGAVNSILNASVASLFSSSRSISYIIPDIVIEEIHNDELRITDHPVETGAAITDHAFKMPSEVVIKCGFSNSSAQAEGYVQSVYDLLLDLQAAREPFDISTGKRVYSNMLIRGLGVVTNPESEFALMVSASCREIIIVDTQNTSYIGKEKNQAMPETTGSINNSGISQLQPAKFGFSGGGV